MSDEGDVSGSVTCGNMGFNEGECEERNTCVTVGRGNEGIRERDPMYKYIYFLHLLFYLGK